MSGFNLRDYEPVKARKLRFFNEYPDGRIIVEILNKESIMEHALIRAAVYRNSSDHEKNLPRGVGHAHEVRDKELRTTNSGKQYESVNFTSWVENCEESAVGRALDNAGFASNMKCSEEEMIKAKQQKELLSRKNSLINEVHGLIKELGSFSDIESTLRLMELGNKKDEQWANVLKMNEGELRNLIKDLVEAITDYKEEVNTNGN